MAECRRFDPAMAERLEQYGKMMRGKSAIATWGWNIFDLPSNAELANFFSTRNADQMQRFEQDVFINGQDPKTYINIQTMKESKAEVELSKEILEKRTVMFERENHGGVEGHAGEEASSSSGFRNGHHPAMDNPDLDGEFYDNYYKKILENEKKEMVLKKYLPKQQ